jgi:hypothetical protein
MKAYQPCCHASKMLRDAVLLNILSGDAKLRNGCFGNFSLSADGRHLFVSAKSIHFSVESRYLPVAIDSKNLSAHSKHLSVSDDSRHFYLNWEKIFVCQLTVHIRIYPFQLTVDTSFSIESKHLCVSVDSRYCSVICMSTTKHT